MGGACATRGRDGKLIQNTSQKRERKRLLERRKRKLDSSGSG
jgi:hypothetical protein